MKTEIEIRNGSGWNRYAALNELTALPVGTRGLLRSNGVQRVEIAPRDSERPYGIAARYYDADGELMFTQGFDQNDSANFIRDRITVLLEQGIQNRINAKAKELARTAFIKRITGWRRNFDAAERSSTKSAGKLRAKFGQLREATAWESRVSRKQCWILTNAVISGEMTYRDAVAKFTK